MKRWFYRRRVAIAVCCAAVFIIGYTINMANKRLVVDQKTYEPLLGVIADAESHGNYNAYFGHGGNKKIKFTKMSVGEVMDWQKRYVAQGSPSSAVGRYQFINTTLAGLVRQLNIDKKQKFDEALQDRLAIALLERRGSEEYVNKEISKTDFAANLAMEWASLPKITGKSPENSYYQSDGLNKALVKPDKVLKAVDYIKAE